MIAGLLFMAGMRRSEVSALRWADVADAADDDGVLVTVRRSKTNQEGETRDVRFVKSGVARAIRTLRATASPGPADRVAPLSPKMVGLRFQAAARAAGVEHVTAHSGRVGLASELTSRGASTTDVMLAGNPGQDKGLCIHLRDAEPFRNQCPPAACHRRPGTATPEWVVLKARLIGNAVHHRPFRLRRSRYILRWS